VGVRKGTHTKARLQTHTYMLCLDTYLKPTDLVTFCLCLLLTHRRNLLADGGDCAENQCVNAMDSTNPSIVLTFKICIGFSGEAKHTRHFKLPHILYCTHIHVYSHNVHKRADCLQSANIPEKFDGVHSDTRFCGMVSNMPMLHWIPHMHDSSMKNSTNACD